MNEQQPRVVLVLPVRAGEPAYLGTLCQAGDEHGEVSERFFRLEMETPPLIEVCQTPFEVLSIAKAKAEEGLPSRWVAAIQCPLPLMAEHSRTVTLVTEGEVAPLTYRKG